ncbi:hypothetical protein GH714_033461 [Hevea brasiliensis]|uniref:Uncharacterized protein n=1 Tax=Hevea brasiliensis TaxID=3981 RepID=A0A6A6NAA4_HEVBR|nr:hypothetical protein GH714_033461 [Hevea brasiliensis]
MLVGCKLEVWPGRRPNGMPKSPSATVLSFLMPMRCFTCLSSSNFRDLLYCNILEDMYASLVLSFPFGSIHPSAAATAVLISSAADGAFGATNMVKSSQDTVPVAEPAMDLRDWGVHLQPDS